MAVRGIRGAITVENNDAKEIASASKALLEEVIEANSLELLDIASVFFTVTNDLDAGFPAAAARDMGMQDVPLLCAREIPVKNSLPKCIRVLLHVNTEKQQNEIKHVYLRDAKKLRPDLN